MSPAMEVRDCVMVGTVDPTVVLDGIPVPAMTTMLYRVCDNDPAKFEEATRLVGLLIEHAISPAALAAMGLAVEQGWQPIETAPKAMGLLLAVNSVVGEGHFINGRWYWNDGRKLLPSPTHWRPLPASPLAASTDQAATGPAP